jgi:GNAT superfamily N-acetyltransferase
VKRDLGEGFELDDDRDRIDVVAVTRYLAEESYWAEGRELAEQEKLVRDAARVVGLYHDGDQIGFCRAVSMSPTLVYLADVYILEDYRGRGFGAELVVEMIERGPYAGCKWLLHTHDAHDLYRKFGFDGLTEERITRTMERPSTDG